MTWLLRLIALALLWFATPAAAQPADACAGLAKADLTTLPDAPTRIASAAVVPASADLPAYCRVQGTIAPQVGFEVRLPVEGWNGRYLQQGCGGMCGWINMGACEDAQARGFATANTDMGHTGSPASALWAYNNRQAELDFAYRATYVTSVAAKAIVARFYGRPADKSYFRGCSTGGRQALVLAQRFPAAFDGIVAGAPVLSQTGVTVHLLSSGLANLDAAGNPILTPGKVALIGKAAMAACDKGDGLADGIIQDPAACRWRPTALACPAAARDDCLTASEIAAAERIYRGPRNSAGRALFAGGMPLGSEHQWAPAFVGEPGQPGLVLTPNGMIEDILRYMLRWDDLPPGTPLSRFDYDRDWPQAALVEPLYNAQNPDLSAFRARGGKLILWHGWDDLEIPAALSIDYFRKVEAAAGGRTEARQFARFFLLPGVAHCRRGPGPDSFDELSAITGWVEQDRAPDVVTAHKLVTEQSYLGLPRPRFPLQPAAVKWTRPVPAWPLVAMYRGRGDISDPESWRFGPSAAAR